MLQQFSMSLQFYSVSTLIPYELIYDFVSALPALFRSTLPSSLILKEFAHPASTDLILVFESETVTEIEAWITPFKRDVNALFALWKQYAVAHEIYEEVFDVAPIALLRYTMRPQQQSQQQQSQQPQNLTAYNPLGDSKHDVTTPITT
jgi:hypothetical protein